MTGGGSVYKRNRIYWVSFYLNGRHIRRSAKTESESKARKFLLEQIRSTRSGQEHRVMFADLVALIISDYEARDLRTKYDLKKSRLPHLEPWFGGRRAVDITPQLVRRYIADRKTEGAANGTINRELGVLKRGFRMAVQDGVLFSAPHIQLLREGGARQGFVSNDQFEAICSRLGAGVPASKAERPLNVRLGAENAPAGSDYQDVARFMYLTGWRVSEALTLEWRDIDLEEGTIRLRSEHSKNLATRRIRMGTALRAILESRFRSARGSRESDAAFRVRFTRLASASNGPFVRLVFHHNGRPIHRGSISRAWRKAAVAAGCAGIMLHDLRRSAARNLVRAGASERVAMAFLGHKTRSMFDRYNIVNDDDLLAAQGLLSDYLTAQGEASNVTRIKK